MTLESKVVQEELTDFGLMVSFTANENEHISSIDFTITYDTERGAVTLPFKATMMQVTAE